MMETHFNTPPSLPDAQSIFFLNAFVPLLSCLVYLGRFDFIFTLRGYGQNSLHNLCLHGHWPPYFFAGGIRRRPKPCCSCAPCSSPGSPATPTRLARARVVLTAIYLDRSSSVLHVSRNTEYKSAYFSSANEVHRTE
jgi:hypothetical protein